MPPYPGFCGPTYQSQSRLARFERCMNFYPERIEVSNRQQVVLYPTPGVTSFATATEAPCRGVFAQAGRCFTVMGETLYEVSTNGVLTSLGTVTADQNPATFATNGDGGSELFVTSGDKGYLYNLTTGVFSNPVNDVTQGGMVDGYFVALDQSTSTLKVSDLLDGTTWSGIGTLQRSAASDPWQALLVRDRKILLFGTETTESIYNAGSNPFPFAPVPGVLIPYGIAAPFSAKSMGNSVLWLTQSKEGARQVVAMSGYNVRRVSTHAVEYQLSQYTSVSDAVAYTYQDQGHQFYVLNFPSAGATWVYDLAIGMWHERGSYNSAELKFGQWGPQYHCHFNNQHLVGDSTTGTLYTMSIDVYTDTNGNGLHRQRIPPTLRSDQDRVLVNRFQLHCDVGIGLPSATAQGYDPQVMMQVSRDGGLTWGYERWRSAGKIGEYLTRAQWWRCGSGRNVICAVMMSDPVPWRILDAIIDVQPGMH